MADDQSEPVARVFVVDRRALVAQALASGLASLGHRVTSYSTLQEVQLDAGFGSKSVIVAGSLDSSWPVFLHSPRVIRASDDSSIASIAAELAAEPLTEAPVTPAVEVFGPRFTSRERQILTLIAKGHSAAEMAMSLGLSRSTVEHHKRQLFARVGVQSQAHALALTWGDSAVRRAVR